MIGDEGRFDGPATPWLASLCRGSGGAARGLSERPNEGAKSTFADEANDIELDPLGFALCALFELPLTPFGIGTELRPSGPNG